MPIKPKVDITNRYLIACDLDGTLLNNQNQLSQTTITYIKKLTQLGHLVCLITGRPYNGSIHLYEQLGLDTIMVNQNGAFMSKPVDPCYIPIAIGFSRALLKMLLENQKLANKMINILIEGMNACWLWQEPTSLEIAEEMKDIYHLRDRKVNIIHGDFKQINTDISNVIFEVPEQYNLDEIIYEIKNICPTLTARNWKLPKSKKNVIEICTRFASKLTAVKYLQSYYGIPHERCLAFGDGDNDVEMLVKTTYSFALKNASPAAKLAARYLTKDTNNDDGVVKELISFFKLD